MNLLKTLQARRKQLVKRIAEERAAFQRLKYKSNHVRRSSSLPARIGWFTDRLGELDLVISLVKEQIPPKEFVTHLAGDDLDRMLSGF